MRLLTARAGERADCGTLPPLWALCIALLCAAGGLRCQAADEPDAQALIEQLRHTDYDVRRAAAEKLTALGEAARNVLERAARADDVETRATAATLLAKLETASVVALAFDRDGRPAAGAEAEVRTQAQQPWMSSNDQSARSIAVDADGTARLAGLAPKDSNLSFTWKNWTVIRLGSPHWSLRLNRGENPFFVTLARNGAAEVRAQDAGGAPLKDARVQLYSGRGYTQDFLDLQLAVTESWQRDTPGATTDAKGVARVEAGEGIYQCVVQADGCLPRLAGTVRVREGATTMVPPVSLAPKSVSQLRMVLQKADGTPLKKQVLNVSLDRCSEEDQDSDAQREARQMRAQANMRRATTTQQTDDDGKVTFEDLRPGKYRFLASSGDLLWHLSEATVVAGQPPELPPLKPAAVGSIKGKVLGSDGKGMAWSTVTVLSEQEIAAELNGVPYSDWRYLQRRAVGVSNVSTREDGNYELKNVLPGRYAMHVTTRYNQFILVFGVEVVAGKATAAPDAALPKSPQAAQTVKGSVVLPDGRPAQGANVTMSSRFANSGSWGTNCDDKGQFQYSGDSPEYAGGRLIVKLSGYKPACLDLSAAGLKLDALTVKMEKQEYGSLRIKVVDEAGNPLSGASVSPFGSGYRAQYFRGQPQERQTATNRNGEARFTGLAVGERTVVCQCDGYYPPEEFKTVVVSSREALATVTMRKGLALTGRVEMPEGQAASRVVVALSANSNRTSCVKEDGSFAFTGLAPGDYSVSAAAPGLTDGEHQKITLRADAAPPEVRLKLVRPAGTAIALDARYQGYAASLMPKDSWNPLAARGPVDWQQCLYAPVDGAGRVEFWGVVPGDYDVLIAPTRPQFGYSRYPTAASRRVTASLVAGSLSLGALKSVSELATMPGAVLKTEDGSASVSGRVVCTPAPSRNNAALTLKLVGPRATASTDLSYGDEYSRSQRQPVIIGTPPVGGPPRPPDHGSFAFQGLPAGEYKLVLDLSRYSRARQPVEATPAPVVLASFAVRRDEQADLGTLTCNLPPSLSAAGDSGDWQTNRWQAETDPEDQIPAFQP